MNSPHWPLFGFGCLSFVLICTVIAVAIFFVFKSGEKGSTKLGAPAGCLVGCALMFVALLAALGVALVLCLHAKQELVRHGPFKRFEFDLEPRHLPAAPPVAPGAEPATRHARLVIELAGDADWTDLSEDVRHWLREQVSADFGVRVESRSTPAGPRTALIFEVDVPESDLERLRRDLRDVLPTLRLPQHIEVELKDD
jgi:hypothetical protein